MVQITNKAVCSIMSLPDNRATEKLHKYYKFTCRSSKLHKGGLIIYLPGGAALFTGEGLLFGNSGRKFFNKIWGLTKI